MGLVETLVIWLGGPWSWWLLGLALLALEIFLPGTFFLWFGVSAIIVGTVGLFFAFDWKIQLLAWGALAVVLLLIGRRYFRRTEDTTDPFLNERGSRYVGRVFTLAEPIVQNTGSLRIDDTVWRVTGPDMPAGTRVAVKAVQGSSLLVERQAA